jgi:putative DNA primase/helicase
MDQHWQRAFEYNELSNKYLVTWENGDGAPCQQLIDEDFVTEGQRWLEEVYDVRFGRGNVERSMFLQCSYNRRHPIRDYLAGLGAKTLDKDETEGWELGIDKFFIDHFGVVDTTLHRAYSRYFFVSAVARAMNPGAKVDTMVVLIGGQGTKKSSSFQALCPDPSYFSDTKMKIGSKDALEQVRGKFIYELAELASLKKAENDDIKNFLSSQVDSYRPAYERQVRDVPRTCVFVGSVNEECFITDLTGSRRFWPMKVTKAIDDVEVIVKGRDSWWAEAYSLYKLAKGRPVYWLDPELEEQRSDASLDHVLDDGWEGAIDEYLGQKAISRTEAEKAAKGGTVNCYAYMFTAREVLAHLGLETHQIKHSHIIRASTILRESGCEKQRAYRPVEIEGAKSRKITYWTPPSDYTN